MTTTESSIEQELIFKLVDLEYTLRPDIRNAFTREDGMLLNYTLVDIQDWCKNTFEIVHQLSINSEELYSRWMGGTNLEKGDTVFTAEAHLVNALLVPDTRKYILSQRVVVFKTKPSVANEFIMQLAWSEGFQSTVNLLVTGSTARGISQKALQGVLITFPDKSEQQHIAHCLSSLDTQIIYESENLTP